MLKTEVKNTSKEDDALPYKIVERKTMSQRHNAVYPMMLYNIGQTKLIL